MTNTQNKLDELLENTLLADYVDTQYVLDECDTVSEACCYIQENYIYTAEVVYYNKAMHFLMDNDPSLQNSLSLVLCQTTEITSELLATVLLQEMLHDELCELDLSSVFEE